MTHRAETIMATLETELTGLATTGANIKRTRTYPVDNLPALTLEMGEDQVIEGSGANMQHLDRLLEVRVVLHVKTSSEIETALNTIREEVHVAMMADRQHGLAYVIDTIVQGDSDAETEPADQKVGRLTMTFVIMYRHSITNPGA